MLNRMTMAMSSIVVLVVAATGLTAQPSRAQSTAGQGKATAQASADECLSKPNAASPRGSHWYYRVDRQTRRRCWYLGPDKMKVRQEAPVERSESPIPPPPPPRELRPDEQLPAETPAAVTATANTVGAYSVAATNFSAAWPAVANAAGSTDREVPTAAVGDDAGSCAATEAQEDMVWPALTPAGRAAAAQSSEPAPGLGHLVLFLAASAAFVAIAFRAVLKLSSAWFKRKRRRPNLRAASPVVRARAPERPVFDQTIEAMRERDVPSPREVAARWDSVVRVPRQPRLPAYEVVSDYEVEAPAPRRRAVA
jgi:hypothetical protein